MTKQQNIQKQQGVADGLQLFADAVARKVK
jgi:hypothetical protein